MTEQEKKLLLSVARILRAHLKDHMNEDYAELGFDYQELDRSLEPFEGVSLGELLGDKTDGVADGQH